MLQDFKLDDRKRVNIIYHDLKSEVNNLIESQIRDVEHIFHLAASSHVDRSITEPMTFGRQCRLDCKFIKLCKKFQS